MATPKQLTIVAGVGLGMTACVVALIVHFTGVLKEWDGIYAGILRPSGQTGAVRLLRDPAEAGNTVLVLNAPDLKGGSCTINCARHLGRMEFSRSAECSTPTARYMVSGRGMDLDADSLSIKLALIPYDRRGVPDFDHEVPFEFVGTRSGTSEARLPPLFPSAQGSSDTAVPAVASAAAAKNTAKCIVAMLECGMTCDKSGNPKRGMNTSERAAYETARADDERCNAACERLREDCERGNPVAPASSGIGMGE